MNTKKETTKTLVLAQNFEQFLQQKGIVPKTISRHQREVNRFVQWLRVEKDRSPDNATKKDILDYLKHAKENRNLRNTSQNNILQKLKNYYSFLAKEYETQNVTLFLKIRGTNQKHLDLLFTPDELNLLCDAYYCHLKEHKPSKKEIYFYPDQKTILQGYYIALTLMAYQALQVKEIENLRANDFDFRKATLTIAPSRTGAGRILPLDACQIGVLIQYFANGEQKPIMQNRNHFEKLNRTLKKLHPKFKNFRQIRTSKITHWLKLYGLRKTQHLAGHRNITSAEKYITGDFETLQNDMDSFHPLR